MDKFVKIVRNHPHVMYRVKAYKLEVSITNLTNVGLAEIAWDWENTF